MRQLIRNGQRRDRQIADLDAREVLPAVARYTTDAAQSIADSTTTLVNFEDVGYDPRSLVTVGAGWKFTAPVGGYYQVNLRVQFQTTANWDYGDLLALDVYVNGVQVSRLFCSETLGSAADAAPSVQVSAHGSDAIHLNRGDALSVRVLQESGADLALTASGIENHIAIGRITP